MYIGFLDIMLLHMNRLKYNANTTFLINFFGHAERHVGSSFPNRGSNPHPLHWKHRVLTIGPPGKSLNIHLCALGYQHIV